MEEELLTVADVAERLKLNQQTVRNWIDRGDLPATRVGRRVRIRRADFEEIVERGYNARNASSRGVTFSGKDFWSGKEHGEPILRSS